MTEAQKPMVSGEIRIGKFVLEQPYGEEPGKIAIYRFNEGEGGDFDAAPLEDFIAKFYEENF